MATTPKHPSTPPSQPPAPDDAVGTGMPPVRACGTMPVHERLLRTMPGYMSARIASENNAFQFASNMRAGARTGITVIPVVVHVIYDTAAQNISDAQIKSQIAILNQDYRKTNPDVASTPAVFKSLCGDSRIEFELASTDPAGQATTGITRTQTARTSFDDTDQMKSAATGGHDAWPADKYLNLWTVPRLTSPQGDLLGYAQFPGGAAATDGVVILHSAFGNTGTATAPFNLGRTATHEIGHWLNLRHIWGDDGGGCNGDDFVADTPNCADHNFGKPVFPHVSCNNGPNGDLFMNYMDYTDDDSMFMFTNGQILRMQACLDTDRSAIGHTKPAPTLALSDNPTITLATKDFSTISFRDQHLPTVSVRDFPTVSIRDVQPTAFFQDVAGPVFPGPIGDPSPFGAQSAGGAFAAGGVGRHMPFVLSTPHHTMAWRQSFPDIAEQRAAQLMDSIGQYEQVLAQYQQADAAGALSAADAARAGQLAAEYAELVDEYRQLVGS